METNVSKRNSFKGEKKVLAILFSYYRSVNPEWTIYKSSQAIFTVSV